MQEYTSPQYRLTSFHCPHCGVFAHQKWFMYINAYEKTAKQGVGHFVGTGITTNVWKLTASQCAHCHKHALWMDEKIIYPNTSVAPLPSTDMPSNVSDEFMEARNVLSVSARASAALLRLALQKLCKHLGQSGKNINDDIAELVKQGLSPKIQEALDIVRVVGNNAVHPGEMDLRDDVDTALKLFKIINMIVESMITQPNEVKELFEKLPEGAKQQISERDSK